MSTLREHVVSSLWESLFLFLFLNAIHLVGSPILKYQASSDHGRWTYFTNQSTTYCYVRNPLELSVLRYGMRDDHFNLFRSYVSCRYRNFFKEHVLVNFEPFLTLIADDTIEDCQCYPLPTENWWLRKITEFERGLSAHVAYIRDGDDLAVR